MTKVSVIIPAYNRANCIERAIKSAQNQTVTDIEIIVVDDASTDNTVDVVKAIQDERIRCIPCQTNRGPGAARNEGLKVARGEYIAFLDSDDEWLPQKLARQVERMEAETEEVGVCFCGGTVIKDGIATRMATYMPNKEWEHDPFRQFVTGQIPFLTSSILFRRSCLKKSGLMTPEMRWNEDAEFLLRLFSHYGLATIPEPYAVWNLVVSSKTKHYDALKASLPYRLRHRNMIKARLGSVTATHYTCHLYTNVLCNAIRELRCREACRDLWFRLKVFPLFFPKEIVMILRASFAVPYHALRKSVT